MRRITPQMATDFRCYVEDAQHSPSNLAFLLDNLGVRLEPNYSVKSLAQAENAYWRHTGRGIPPELSSREQFAHLLGQYLGECIIHGTGARWVQCEEDNAMFGQPCIDGFGNERWDRIYPVQLALHIDDLQPSYPGATQRRAFAATLERAVAIHAKKA